MKYTISIFSAYLILVFAILICCAIIRDNRHSCGDHYENKYESCNDIFSTAHHKRTAEESELTYTMNQTRNNQTRNTNVITSILSIVICLAIFFSRKIAINFFNTVIQPIHRTVMFIHNSDGAKDKLCVALYQ